MTRVIVVGGGVMGSSAAWKLAQRGADVVLLEQFGPNHTMGSSHGSSRIFRLAYRDGYYIALAARAQELWRALESATGISVLTLTGAVDHGPTAATTALYDALTTAGHPAELLSPDEATRRWPGLRFDTSVLFHPDAGRVHADDAVNAFQKAAVLHGAEIRHGVRVSGIKARDDVARVELTDGTTLDADAVIVAAGSWLPYVFADIFALPPLRVTQEQPAHFPAPDPLRGWPSFIHHGGAGLSSDDGIYGLGSVDGIKIGRHAVGPIVDPDQRDRSIDQSALAALVDYARAWLPGVDHTRPVATTCLYTVTPDHNFLIERIGPFTVLGGFSGHGFKFAPAIGELAASLVLDEAPAPGHFSLARAVPT